MTSRTGGRSVGPPSGAATLRAYEAVRERIAAGEYATGMWLPEPMVAAAVGASRTPVREALRMLAAEGIVELTHNRGARVARWSAADIEEVYRLRAVLEGHGAALAARLASAEEIAGIRDLQARYEQSVDAGAPAADSARCNDDVHAAILRASGSPRLGGLVDVVSSAPLVTRVLQQYDEGDRRRSVLQHRDVITAIEHRDADLAEAAMRSHILAARYTALRLAEPEDDPEVP